MRPILFSLGPYDFYAAPAFAGLASLSAFLYFRRHREYAGLDRDSLWALMLALAVATIAGGVLAYWLFYGGGPAENLAYLLRRGRVRGGSFYGNLWGATAAALLFARWRGLKGPRLADLIGGAGPLGLAMMRLGCLQHGCCYGEPTDLPWAIVFAQPRAALRRSLHGVPLHPAQIYESLGALAIFLVVHFVVFRRARDGRLPAGSAFAASITLYAVLRFLLELVRGGDPGWLRPFGLTSAQTLSALTLGAAVLLHRRWTRAAGSAG